MDVRVFLSWWRKVKAQKPQPEQQDQKVECWSIGPQRLMEIIESQQAVLAAKHKERAA